MGTESNINEVAQSVSSLSLNKTSESWIWVPGLKTRMENLLETGFESDLTLLLGEEKTALKVHKLILMSASPRFHQMFRKLRCNSFEPAVIKLEDVNPATFKMLIKHFYIGESGADITNALGLLSIATEYEADDLIAECNALMESEITNEIVLQLFQDAMQFGNKKLIISSLDHICKNAAKILKREEFQNLRLECLIEIMKQDGLCVYTEMEVFDAVIKWGEAECLRQGLEPLEPKDMRLVLNKAIAYVRFPNMEQAEFALNVATKCLLDEKEMISLMICFMVPPQNRSKLPSGRFISTPRTYGFNSKPSPSAKMQRLRRGGGKKTCRISGQEAKPETLLFKVNKMIWLTGVSIYPTVWSKDDYQYHFDKVKCSYSVSKNEAPDEQILKKDNVAFRDPILFDFPIQLKEKEIYKMQMNYKGLLKWRHKTIDGEGNVLMENASWIDVAGDCEAVKTFKFTNKTGDSNEIIFEFSREKGDSMPITAGLISELVFQLE